MRIHRQVSRQKVWCPCCLPCWVWASHRPSSLHCCCLQVVPRWIVPGTFVGPIVSSLQQRVWTLFRNRLSLRVRVSVLGESDSGSLMMLLICFCSCFSLLYGFVVSTSCGKVYLVPSFRGGLSRRNGSSAKVLTGLRVCTLERLLVHGTLESLGLWSCLPIIPSRWFSASPSVYQMGLSFPVSRCAFLV